MKKILWALLSLCIACEAFAQSGGFPNKPTFGRVVVKNTTAVAPRIYLYSSDAAVNSKCSGFNATETLIQIVLCDDSLSGMSAPFRITRSGTSATKIDMDVPAVNISGAPVTAETNGSFTATFTTGCTTQPTSTMYWRKVGTIVTLYAVGHASVCTSNTTSDTVISGLPAGILPATNVRTNSGYCIDSNVTSACFATVSSAGTISVSREVAGWTASGARMFKSMVLTYSTAW